MDQKMAIVFTGIFVMVGGVFLAIILSIMTSARPSSPNTIVLLGVAVPKRFVPLGAIVLGCAIILSQMGGSYWSRFVG